MKTKILILLIFIGLTNSINAQQETIKTLGVDLPAATDVGDLYFKDVNNYFTKFLGDWLYDDGTNYLKITFIKKERVRMGPTDTYFDLLASEFLFKVNGVTIYDTYGANSNIDDGFKANYITGTGVYDFAPNKAELSYTEPPLNGGCAKYGFGTLNLEYVPVFPDSAQLIWTRTNAPVFGDAECFDGSPKDMSDLLIPANMVLIKQ